MDGAGVMLQGPLWRAPRRRLRAPVSRVRAGAHRAVWRPGPTRQSCRALHGRGQPPSSWARTATAPSGDRRRLGVQQPAPGRVPRRSCWWTRAGSVYAATRRTYRRREVLLLTFAWLPVSFHTLALGLRRRDWVDARGVRRRAPRLFLLSEELFLHCRPGVPRAGRSASPPPTCRRSPTGRTRAAPRQSTDFPVPAVRVLNANGAKPAGQDALTDKGHELQGSFWINHTWDHQRCRTRPRWTS